jgi:hypothetical protein
MGLRIENYSLNELHRIAVPGSVTPSLFWVSPVGKWRPRELDDIWRLFTKHPGQCLDSGDEVSMDCTKPQSQSRHHQPEGTDVRVQIRLTNYLTHT